MNCLKSHINHINSKKKKNLYSSHTADASASVPVVCVSDTDLQPSIGSPRHLPHMYGNTNGAAGSGSSFRERLLCANGPLWRDGRMVFTVAATSVATRRIMRYSCYRWQARAARSRIGPASPLWSSQGEGDWYDTNVDVKPFLIAAQ